MAVLRKQNAAVLCSATCFSLLAAVGAFCTFILHSVNFVFRHKETIHYNETNEHQMVR